MYESHTDDELRFLGWCAVACGDHAEAARMAEALAEKRALDRTGPRLRLAAEASRPTPDEAASKVAGFRRGVWRRWLEGAS